ncbi:MAG: hypothetical protein U1E56_03020 [Bauldia sp.]
MTDRHIDLVFCCYPRTGAVADFTEAARRITAQDDGVSAHVVTTDFNLRGLAAPLRFAARPTVWVEFDWVKFFRPLRGKRLRQIRGQTKVDEMRRFEAAGLPVAKWAVVEPGTVFDPQEWGPYVVEKPIRGWRGASIAVRRTGRVRFIAPEDRPEDHLGRLAGMFVQKFVYTGRWPVSYRVLTYFGEPVAATRFEAANDRPPLEGPTAFDKHGGISVVASARGCSATMIDEPDILALARRVHSVYPETPVLGIDILREATSGALYISEANPAGKCWSLGDNERSAAFRETLGLQNLRDQFGVVDILTRVSVDIARRYAA